MCEFHRNKYSKMNEEVNSKIQQKEVIIDKYHEELEKVNHALLNLFRMRQNIYAQIRILSTEILLLNKISAPTEITEGSD